MFIFVLWLAFKFVKGPLLVGCGISFALPLPHCSGGMHLHSQVASSTTAHGVLHSERQTRVHPVCKFVCQKVNHHRFAKKLSLCVFVFVPTRKIVFFQKIGGLEIVVVIPRPYCPLSSLIALITKRLNRLRASACPLPHPNKSNLMCGAQHVLWEVVAISKVNCQLNFQLKYEFLLQWCIFLFHCPKFARRIFYYFDLLSPDCW